jgi:hypothetical protein
VAVSLPATLTDAIFMRSSTASTTRRARLILYSLAVAPISRLMVADAKTSSISPR